MLKERRAKALKNLQSEKKFIPSFEGRITSIAAALVLDVCDSRRSKGDSNRSGESQKSCCHCR